MLQNTVLTTHSQSSAEADFDVEGSLCKSMLVNSIWLAGIPSFLFGVVDRGIAAFADGYLTGTDISQFLLAASLFVSWLYFKPDNSASEAFAFTPASEDSSDSALMPTLPSGLHNRLRTLSDSCIARQEHILPFPFVCQIYHLLNLKHLEDIHSFSLGQLRVIDVSSFQPTRDGGRLRFQTMLDSPFNILRMWRSPIVEVDLILHTPYMVELKIPAYRDREITVLFRVQPLGKTCHKLFVDISSNLRWPKPLLQVIMLLAASLTLLEDLPYLRRLSKRNWDRLMVRSGNPSSPKSMQLFQRYVDLYGGNLALLQPQEAE